MASNPSDRFVEDYHSQISPDNALLRCGPHLPALCYIDRRIDDKFVQKFVSNNRKKLTLPTEAIGDLCSAHGAKQILLEAATLLVSGSVVRSIVCKYAMVLRAMATDLDMHARG